MKPIKFTERGDEGTTPQDVHLLDTGSLAPLRGGAGQLCLPPFCKLRWEVLSVMFQYLTCWLPALEGQSQLQIQLIQLGC